MRKAIQAIVLVAVCLVVALFPRLARAGGTLYLAKGGERGTELPLERTDVEVDVSGSVVSATVSQRFTSSSKEPIEVVYLFPLPQRAAVDAMEMTIGQRTVKASIAKRADARAAYDRAIQQGHRAALLEQERPNMFTFSVGNVDPGAAIDVKLHYFEVAAFDAGTYELVVPTTLGPRFNPASVKDAERITTTYSKNGGVKLGIRVHLDAGTDIEKVDVPTHAVDVSRSGAKVADVKLKTDDIPNRDFVFRWRLAADTVKPAVFAHRESANAPGYVSVMLEPKHDPKTEELAPRELFFLLDTSGSMHGAPLDAAKAAVKKAIDAMGPNDTFNIVDFADKASSFAARPLPNTPANREKAHQHLDWLKSAGGTNQLLGIHAALASPGDDLRIRYVMFFTDGYIGNEKDVVDLTKREIGRARIFSFGVGASVNRYLLDEVAHAGRGHAEYLRPREDAKQLVDRFYQRIGKPYLTDVEIDWGNLAVSDARPTKIPDLSAFSPLVVHARYAKAGSGDVIVKGRLGGKPYAQKISVTLPDVEPKNGSISRLWARETIADLERKPKGSIDGEAVTQVALSHDLVTAYTSFVAIDITQTNGRSGLPTMVRQPSEAPADVDLRSAGGEITGVQAGMAAPPADSERVHYAMAEGAPGHRGGCAGCTTARSDRRSGLEAFGAVLAALGISAIRRRNRRRLDRPTPRSE
jgi:Ca-activated chloride channel homolog